MALADAGATAAPTIPAVNGKTFVQDDIKGLAAGAAAAVTAADVVAVSVADFESFRAATVIAFLPWW